MQHREKASELVRGFATLAWLAVIERLLVDDDHGPLTSFLRRDCFCRLMRRGARPVPPNFLKYPRSCANDILEDRFGNLEVRMESPLPAVSSGAASSLLSA